MNKMTVEQIKNRWAKVSNEEKLILGRPNFLCGSIAEKMRQKGIECENKSEAEQALVVYTLLQFHAEYGVLWADKFGNFIKEDETQPSL